MKISNKIYSVAVFGLCTVMIGSASQVIAYTSEQALTPATKKATKKADVKRSVGAARTADDVFSAPVNVIPRNPFQPPAPVVTKNTQLTKTERTKPKPKTTPKTTTPPTTTPPANTTPTTSPAPITSAPEATPAPAPQFGNINILTYVNDPKKPGFKNNRIGKVKVKVEREGGSNSCSNRGDKTEATTNATKYLKSGDKKILVHGTAHYLQCDTGKYTITLVGRDGYSPVSGTPTKQTINLSDDETAVVSFVLNKDAKKTKKKVTTKKD